MSAGIAERDKNGRIVSVASSHGQANQRDGTRTSVYTRWADMKQRCLNPNNHAYENYGGRGITVCDRWVTFENFYADMGDPPPGLSLDRFDNDGNYEPGNCRWATPEEQIANQRVSDKNRGWGTTRLAYRKESP